MDRRTFIAGMTGGLLAAPLAVGAQQADRVYRIGILGNVPLSDPGSARLWGAFADGLRDLGYVDGRNITLENLSSEGQYERLPTLAADLVRHKVDVIVAPAVQNVMAAKQVTQTIPIVMVSVGDPVGNGLVASLARPGGNVTGTSFLTSALVGKQLELLKQITPHVSRLAFLVNPANPGLPLALEEAKAAAHSLGVQLQAVEARRPADLERAFAAMTRERAGAFFVPWKRVFPCSPGPNRTARGEDPPARDVRAPGVRGRGRPGLLRTLGPRKLSAGCGLRGQDPQGRQAR
jgi:putative ABC transport system substrate-binding protein